MKKQKPVNFEAGDLFQPKILNIPFAFSFFPDGWYEAGRIEIEPDGKQKVDMYYRQNGRGNSYTYTTTIDRKGFPSGFKNHVTEEEFQKRQDEYNS